MNRSWLWPTLEEAQKLLRSLGPGQLTRLLQIVYRPPTHTPGLSPTDFLVACIADWLSAMTPLGETEQGLLLRDFRPRLYELAAKLEGAQESDELPLLILGLYNYKYATWEGGETDWWDIANAKWVAVSPPPPIWTTALHLNSLWFASVRQLEKLRMGGNPEHGKDTGTVAGSPA